MKTLSPCKHNRWLYQRTCLYLSDFFQINGLNMNFHLKYCIFSATLLLSNIAASAQCIQWPSSTFQPTPNPKTQTVAPAYGIYWFKSDGSHQTAKRAFTPPNLAKQFANGKMNTLPKHLTIQQAKQAYIKQLEQAGYFDPKKPTLLFIHGDQATFTKQRKRIDFCYSYPLSNGKQLNTVATNQGWHNWNVGVFYWNQFADDVQGKSLADFVKAVTYPEMKIYSSRNRAGMRWSYLDKKGQLRFCDQGMKHCTPLPRNKYGETLSVSDLAWLAYKNAIPNNYHQPIRIAGQSLGAQVAIQLTHRVTTHPKTPQPSQLVLLDPYFTPRIHHILIDGHHSDSVAHYNYKTMQDTLKRNPKLAFTIYRTTHLSTFPAGARNKALEKQAAYLRVCPAYLKNVKKKAQIVIEHLSAAYIYFHSMDLPTPADFVSANTPLHKVHNLMQQRRYCTIENFSKGCTNAAEKPIRCPLEKRWGKVY
jgi:hypothetical protein